MDAALQSSTRHDWRTPEWLTALLALEFGDIALDPCADPDHQFARVNLAAPEDDGLIADWRSLASGGLIFCNPPYGESIPRWVQACHESRAEAALLVPARPGTRWWRAASEGANARVCLYGRLRFEGAGSSAPFPSALFYWGRQPGLFCDTFDEHGEVLTLRRDRERYA